jgi:hypothetical protein
MPPKANREQQRLARQRNAAHAREIRERRREAAAVAEIQAAARDGQAGDEEGGAGDDDRNHNNEINDGGNDDEDDDDNGDNVGDDNEEDGEDDNDEQEKREQPARGFKLLKPTEVKKFTADIYDQDAPALWMRWTDSWRIFVELAGFQQTNKKGQPIYTEKEKLLYMLNAAGDKIAELYESVKDDAKPDTMDTAIEKITKYITPSYSSHQARRLFRETEWHEYETVNQYYKKLVDAAKLNCKFNAAEQEIEIASLIIANCPIRPGSDLKLMLSRIHPISLKEVLELCRLAEAMDKKPKTTVNATKTESNKENNEINFISNRRSASAASGECNKCGGIQHRPGQRCPAIGQQCNKCKRWNHFKAKCWGADYIPMRNRTASRNNEQYKRRRSISTSKSRSVSRSRSKKKHKEKKHRSDRERISSRKKGKHKKKKKFRRHQKVNQQRQKQLVVNQTVVEVLA